MNKKVKRDNAIILHDMNCRLELFGQTLRVVEYTGGSSRNGAYVKFSTGKELYSNNALVCLRRIDNANDTWINLIDLIYDSHDNGVDIIKQIKIQGSRRGGLSCQSKHSEKIKLNLNTGVPWNVGTAGNYPHTNFWQTGKTKYNDDRLAKLSVDRTGPGNPMYGSVMSEEDKLVKSSMMKQKILDGKFTPNSNNRHTHWDSQYNGAKFRSAWEAIYYSFNETDLHEKLRIPYIYNGQLHIYIVDFINHEKKTVTEVKPKELLVDEKTREKIKALEMWADNNGYTMQIITQVEISKMSAEITDFSKFDENTQLKIKKLNEAYTKNRNQ